MAGQCEVYLKSGHIQPLGTHARVIREVERRHPVQVVVETTPEFHGRDDLREMLYSPRQWVPMDDTQGKVLVI